MVYRPDYIYLNAIELLNDLNIGDDLLHSQCQIPRTTIARLSSHLLLFEGVNFPGSNPALDEPDIHFPLRVATYFKYFATSYRVLHRLLSGQDVYLPKFKNKIIRSGIIVDMRHLNRIIASITTELCRELDNYCLGMLFGEWHRNYNTRRVGLNSQQIILQSMITPIAAPANVIDENIESDFSFRGDVIFGAFLQKRAEFLCDNIVNMMNRLNNNKEDIISVFFSNAISPTNDNFSINRIQVSSNDSHRQARHVVILELCCRDETTKIVYKPADIEVDCLIFGESEVLNNIDSNFFQCRMDKRKNLSSLAEIINKLIKDNCPVPTYKILPYNYGSKYSLADTKNNFNSSYGYIQFIEHYIHGGKISKTDIYQYWTIVGKLAAIACIIGTSDLHYENIICGNWNKPGQKRRFAPYFIDLEASLNRSVDINATGIFHNANGIDHSTGSTFKTFLREESQVKIDRGLAPSFYHGDINNDAIDIKQLNHILVDDNKKSNYKEHIREILYGVKAVSRISERYDQIESFKELSVRLDGVVIRSVPILTGQWINIYQDIYYRCYYSNRDYLAGLGVNDPIREIINRINIESSSTEHYMMAQNRENLARLVAGLITDSAHNISDLLSKEGKPLCDVQKVTIIIAKHAANDLILGDIPIFYMKLIKGFWILLSSRGDEICRLEVGGNYTADIVEEIMNRLQDKKLSNGRSFFNNIVEQICEKNNIKSIEILNKKHRKK